LMWVSPRPLGRRRRLLEGAAGFLMIRCPVGSAVTSVAFVRRPTRVKRWLVELGE